MVISGRGSGAALPSASISAKPDSASAMRPRCQSAATSSHRAQKRGPCSSLGQWASAARANSALPLAIAPDSCDLAREAARSPPGLGHHPALGGDLELPQLGSRLEGRSTCCEQAFDLVQAVAVPLEHRLRQGRAGGVTAPPRRAASDSHRSRITLSPRRRVSPRCSSTGRAAHVASPAAKACRIVSSISPCSLAPVGGPPVQLRHPRALGPLQPGTQQIGEQVMVAIPAALAHPAGPGTGWRAPAPPACPGRLTGR